MGKEWSIRKGTGGWERKKGVSYDSKELMLVTASNVCMFYMVFLLEIHGALIFVLFLDTFGHRAHLFTREKQRGKVKNHP